MMPIMDIPFQVFVSFRQKNPVFFWLETEKRFMILKPYNDAWLRVIVNKTGTMSDFIWRDTNLSAVSGGFQIGAVEGLDTERVMKDILLELKKKPEVSASNVYV